MTIAVGGILRVEGRMLAGWSVSHRVMPASPALFVTAGQAADLSLSAVYALSAGQGAIAFAGQAAGLVRTGAKVMLAGQGAFALTGRPAILRRTRKMTAAQGSFVLTGQAATLTHTLTGAWPDATNTGHTGTLTASPGNLTSTSNGQTIQNLNVTGTITLQHSSVIVRNCQAQLIVAGPAPGQSAPNCIIEDCTIVGDGTMERTGIVIAYATAAMVRRNDVSGTEEGIYLAFSGTARDNWIHNLSSPGDPVPEVNGITCQGGETGILIEHNTVDIASASQAAVFISSDYAAIANVDVNNNKLLGGNYCVISQQTAYPTGSVSFTSNRMDNWVTAPFLVIDNFVSWAGNVDDSSSATIPGPSTPATTVGPFAVNGQAATLIRSTAGAGGFPNATNTGPTPGTVFTATGNITSSSHGQIIQNLRITGNLTINHNNVTVRDCEFNCSGMIWGLFCDYSTSGVIVERCHFYIVDNGTYDSSHALSAMDVGPNTAEVRYCNVEGVENGIQSHKAYIHDCYIHDQWIWAIGGGDVNHTDCIACSAAGTASGLRIEHNTIIAVLTGGGLASPSSPAKGSSSIGLDTGQSNVTITNNLLCQGTIVIYGNAQHGVGSSVNTVITNNRFMNAYDAALGAAGAFSGFNPSSSGFVWSGNVVHETGATVAGPSTYPN